MQTMKTLTTDPVYFIFSLYFFIETPNHQTFDAWDDVLYIAMYGCDEYPYYDVLNHNDNTTCSNPFAFGWLAPLVLLPLGIIGSYILPPILIGIVTMKVSATV
jgi:hypothetical protein